MHSPCPAPSRNSPGNSATSGPPTPQCPTASASSRSPTAPQHGAGGDHPPAEPDGQCGRAQRGQQVAGRQHGEHAAGLKRRQAPALLQEQRQQQVAGRLLAPEQRLHGQPDPQRADREDGRVEQRLPAVPAGPAQVAREQRQQHRAERQARPRPGRPALLAAVRERQHDRDQARRQQGGARQVEVAGALGAGLRHQPPGRRQGDQADRHVDPEDGPPAQAGHVRVDEHAADQLPADGGDAHDHAVDADRADPVATGVGHAEDRHDVRRHDRAPGALHQPRRDQEARDRGRAAHSADASTKAARPMQKHRRRP